MEALANLKDVGAQLGLTVATDRHQIATLMAHQMPTLLRAQHDEIRDLLSRLAEHGKVLAAAQEPNRVCALEARKLMTRLVAVVTTHQSLELGLVRRYGANAALAVMQEQVERVGQNIELLLESFGRRYPAPSQIVAAGARFTDDLINFDASLLASLETEERDFHPVFARVCG